jgi:metal-responsive CopG/Arc/MetJ family transcriptional regulator
MKEKPLKTAQFSLNVGLELLRRVDRVAKRVHATRTFVVRHMLRTYLPEIEKRGLFNNSLEVK